jgi:hypothetical protein
MMGLAKTISRMNSSTAMISTRASSTMKWMIAIKRTIKTTIFLEMIIEVAKGTSVEASVVERRA